MVLTSCSSSPSTEKARADSGVTMSEVLKFTGSVRGLLTSGLNSQGVIKGEPSPIADEGKVFAQTSCAEFKVGDDNQSVQAWEADVYGKLGGQKVNLRLYLEDEVKPGTYSVFNSSQPPGTAFAYLETATISYNYAEAGGGADTLHINDDMHSGTVQAVLSDRPFGGGHEVRVSGQWRCA
ncbi:hypothetical protein ACLMNJ_37410 [Streptomyces seoulensis]